MYRNARKQDETSQTSNKNVAPWELQDDSMMHR